MSLNHNAKAVKKNGRPAKATPEAVAAVLKLYSNGVESTAKIGEEVNLSHDTVLRILKRNEIKLQHGGSRANAGRRSGNIDAEAELMRRQQFIDSKSNSWEVGIGKKHIDDEAWIKMAGTAFKQTRKGYRRDDTKLNITNSNESLGIPSRLPRALPWPNA